MRRTMPSFIGFPELIVLAIVLLLIFGPKRLPEIGRSMGKGMREFKDSVTGKDDEPEQTTPAELTATPVDQPVTPAAPAPTPVERDHTT
jgi:sec-independent protein translocase protein TatA